ncbi:MAG TPA: M48 family metallopeptidase [Flavihumibacter sp.]|nr:M48 family metallopeptidase [Flavihumibacter sp.]
MTPSQVVITPSFRREVIQTAGRIIQFTIVYCIMVCLGLALAAACVWGGIMVVIGIRNFLALMLGLGIAGLGLMVCFFLLKFLFTVNRTDRSGYREVTVAEEPALFDLVRTIARQTGTDFPKHIYLSPDVNASVFYDSSFWSMLLPVRKNLVIGLGLVNALNKGELRAVIAHEFGHFSQRSMKLGSFVYQVNRVIYNMLYDNDGYANFLKSWAGISSYFAFFAHITVRIIQGIQWVLRAMYGYVNKGYMRLSREMEFHADAVAAAVCGGNNLASALEKLPLANACYDEVLTGSNRWLKEGLLTQNFYKAQSYLLSNTPAEEIQDRYRRVTYKDQWASHPATEERTTRLRSLQVNMTPDTASSWTVFNKYGQLQETITRFVYEQAAIEVADKKWIDGDQVNGKLENDRSADRMPALFNGCFDYRFLSKMTKEQWMTDIPVSEAPIMDEEQASLVYKISAATYDQSILESIAKQEIDADYFEFAGVRYHHSDAEEIIKRIRLEVEGWEHAIERFDLHFMKYTWWLAVQSDSTERLRQRFDRLSRLTEYQRAFTETSDHIHALLAPMREGGDLTFDKASEITSHLKEVLEPSVKKQVSQLVDMSLFAQQETLSAKMSAFLSTDVIYIFNDALNHDAFAKLLDVLEEVQEGLQQLQFKALRTMLETQADLISNQARA